MLAAKDELFTRPSGGYTIARSVRFRSSASGNFTRTPASASNRQIWTWSAWLKRGALTSNATLFAVNFTGVDYFTLRFNASNLLQCYFDVNSLNYAVEVATPVWRDPSAWYHIVLAVDTTQATSTNRVKIYVNGTQQTVTAISGFSIPAQNYSTYVNGTYAHALGAFNYSNSQYFDGYLTEINFIDGQALTPSSFGSTNAITGVWQPAKYTGTYGTNGFYLNFSDNSNNTATTIGKDYSGNGNNWTPNNISVTAGVTYDSMTDVPTLTSATAANYAVWNPLDKETVTVTDGNLAAVSGADTHAIRASMGLPLSGKFYWEITVSGLGYGSALGIASATSVLTTGPSSAATRTYQWGSWFNTYNSGVVQYGTNQSITGGTNWSGASQLAAGDVLMIAVDMDNGSMWVGKNNAWFNSSGTANPATNTDPRWTGLGGTTWFAYYSSYGSTSPPTVNINFGQQGFKYTPPTGYVALNTYNLPDSTIKNGAGYMAATLWTGNSTTGRAITGVGFAPDFAWIKNRSIGYSNNLTDTVRGATKLLFSNNTDAEATTPIHGYIGAFTSDGYTLTNGSSTNGYVNDSGSNYVGWNWKAGGTSASNTNGSITSTVSAGATQGFSVVTYTGTGANATVGHGLGVAPKMFILFPRNNVGYAQPVWHTSLGGSTDSDYLAISNSGARNYAGALTGLWNNTAPTSSVFSIGTSVYSNTSAINYVAYCFAAVAGYSAFGSYTGNGSTDGPFIYLGFRPRYVMVKRTDTVGDWYVFDTGRDPYNATTYGLIPNSAGTDTSYTGWGDLLSNGFKIRRTDGAWNASGGTYIYACFAENPFKNALAR